ncbi:TM1812 family CRISPR-associated protein [uncultured Mitsuokella sp.]|uniref:TM1812 family CRISPR-associated protein n=1 Tax=uncultured Mitsuokella sp. TaxID=453120 RepID=UPI00261BA746|nr:TM1812 family CRISPR-associated protein [uncultured Mitsuokella sp.]
MVLSDVKTDENGEVRLSDYPQINRKVKTTNESAVRLLHQDLQAHGQKIDRIYAFATQTVQGCITYRQEKDGEKTSLPYHYEGHEITHLDYTRKCMSDILSEDIWCIIPEPHLGRDNVSLAMNRTLSYTLRIAGQIQEDIEQMRKENPDVRIVLHADCTGGPRHAIMMLINIIRLLQYNDVEIGSLFYSNWISSESGGKIEQINDVYKFYNLIAGAEEFVNFGSVKDLQGYFKERSISPELDDLLLAMGEFADEVKLCRRWRFVAAIDHLKQAIETFERKWENVEHRLDTVIESNDDVRLNDMLMFQLLPQIHKDYSDLLREHDPLSLIKWCLNQGLLQQALTLYTESVPDFLFDSDNGFITMTEDEECRAVLEKAYKEHGKEYTRGFYFLNRFGYGGETAKKKSEKAVQSALENQKKLLRPLFNSLVKEHATRQEAKEAFHELDSASDIVHIQNINALSDVFGWTCSLWDDAERINTPGPYRILQNLILEMYWKNKGAISRQQWSDADACKKRKSIIGFLKGQIQPQDIVRLAGGIGERGSFNVKWRLFDSGNFVLHTDPEKFNHIIDAYAVIKNERNHANHAKEQQGVFDTAESLIAYMQENIQDIESLRALRGDK